MKDSDHVINSENPLHIIINEVEGSISEKNKNICLAFASTDKNKKVLEKYTKLGMKLNIISKQLMLTNLVNMKKRLHENQVQFRR